MNTLTFLSEVYQNMKVDLDPRILAILIVAGLLCVWNIFKK